MMSYDTSVGIREIPVDKQAWFTDKVKATINSTEKRMTTYEEGPWLYKRKGLYYLLYPAGGVPEHLAHSTSKSPTGPWTYRDTIMDVIGKGGAFTNHPGLVDYKGKSYLFYHNGALPGGGGFTRSVSVDEVNFKADGSISRVKPTATAIEKAVRNLNPYIRVEAETIAWEQGVEVTASNNNGLYVTDINNGDYIKVRSVDFGKGAKLFKAGVNSLKGGVIEIRLDKPEGALIGNCEIKPGTNTQAWQTCSTNVSSATGVHDVYFIFKGADGYLFDFDWWKFEKK